MPTGKNSKLYDIFNHSTENDGNNNINEGAHWTGQQEATFPPANPGNTFDTMLEVLPDDISFNSFFPPTQTNNNNNNNNSNEFGHEFVPMKMGMNDFSSVFDQISEENNNNTGATIQPIDIMNQQNGEIAQLWDFNVDTLNMTPSNSSDSATISAPNSYNSEIGSVPLHGTTPLKNTLFSNSLVNNFHQFNNNSHNHQQFNNNYNTASPNMNITSHNNNNNTPPVFKPRSASITKRPSFTSNAQFNKQQFQNEDNALPLTTNNAIRKNSMSRQISSSSLSTYKKDIPSSTSIISNQNNSLNKKPIIQCFNCKTFKTPLWRRDPQGNTLCNACGLFQKLHGTMRPLSLKSDVIKKRNTRKRTKKKMLNENENNSKPINNILPINTYNLPTNNNSNTHTRGHINIPLQIYPNNHSQHSNATNKLLQSNKKTSESTTMTTVNTNVVAELNPTPRLGLNLSNSLKPQSATSLSNLTLNMHSGNNLNNVQSKKSRRSSTSSNNSSSSRTSGRSMVPILPKPSPSSIPSPQFNSSSNQPPPISATNSAVSSPRYINSSNIISNSPLQQGFFSTSTGRPGVSIPRRKLSRNPSYSSSFMAASLQQLQQQKQQQVKSLKQGQESTGSTITMPNSWNSNSNPSSIPKQHNFELFNNSNNTTILESTVEPPSRPESRKSHTSLLSQQLQKNSSSQSSENGVIHSPEDIISRPNTNKSNDSSESMLQTPRDSISSRSSFNGDPLNINDNIFSNRTYTDSLQQQRRFQQRNEENMNFIARNNGNIINGRMTTGDILMNSSSTITTPAPDGQPRQLDSVKETETGRNGNANTNIADELDWLKFGM
ncbi:hypothetical protein NCAS_0F03840 [Naumovozyma castellii]|uniref:GATA-type domain-containing protein n=1 Tax=Naumovozyma castellii TaxID=27288 RepID=G0VH95_NAUCA|nr:hypothetical protein NCAS_0F03840 [Naumovozyma castellii CBS 4309]CCC70868.1 hypothetical protein NCAS_0F03840 [Naumovozyma castellii CBS 4309]